MSRIESVNPARIEWCCAERGITTDELARDIQVSAGTMHKVLEDGRGLTFRQLKKMADYFSRGLLFFLEPGDVNEYVVHSPAFRTLANQKVELSPKVKAIIERAERQRDTFFSLLEDVGDETIWPSFEPPNLPEDDAVGAAAIARNWLGLYEHNTFDDYRTAAEGRGILVFRSNGYAGKWQISKDSPILGFSIYDAKHPLIVVKKQDAESRQTFTLMHELGHLLLHRASYIDDKADLSAVEGNESSANAFAGAVLVPAQFLAQINDATRPNNVSEYDAWLEPNRRAWGVSTEVILRRLLDSNRLPAARYTSYRQWWRENWKPPSSEGGVRTYRHREPIHIFGDKFVRTVLDALNARQITLAKASSYLDGIKIGDVHKLEQYFADS
jgi:Zn-dependent peptidase ImmA (M78 family)